MTKKEQLEIHKAKYSRLKSLTEQSGWKDLQEIIEDEYSNALDIIKSPKYAKQEFEARGVIKFIDRFISLLNSEIDFGKVAKEKYVKKYVGLTPNED